MFLFCLFTCLFVFSIALILLLTLGSQTFSESKLLNLIEQRISGPVFGFSLKSSRPKVGSLHLQELLSPGPQ